MMRSTNAHGRCTHLPDSEDISTQHMASACGSEHEYCLGSSLSRASTYLTILPIFLRPLIAILAAVMAYLLYVDPQLVQMRNALDQDGIVGLAKCILDLERDFSASPATSRILQEPDYPGNSEMLLAEITPRVLHSIFSNTLPVDALKPGFLPRMAKISLLDQHATTIDPGIYVNFLAAGDGSPMTLSDFEGFLDALDATIHNLRTADGTDISSEVNAYYRRIFRRGDLIDANMRSADFENSGALFLQRNRERLQDAQRQGASHITIPGECGWSRNIHARCKDHRTLQSSPAIFRVANCVLRVLYPTEHYQMHHFCLFKIFRSEQAGIGESMGHHLVLSYGNYGGFNFKQAGISVGAAMDMDFKAWLGVCDRGVDILGEIKVMLAAERAKVLAELQLEEAKKDVRPRK
jgi:hypothetical protein